MGRNWISIYLYVLVIKCFFYVIWSKCCLCRRLISCVKVLTVPHTYFLCVFAGSHVIIKVLSMLLTYFLCVFAGSHVFVSFYFPLGGHRACYWRVRHVRDEDGWPSLHPHHSLWPDSCIGDGIRFQHCQLPDLHSTDCYYCCIINYIKEASEQVSKSN